MHIDGTHTRYGNYLNYDLGVEYFLAKGFNFMFELNGFLQGDTREGGNRIPGSDARYLTISPGFGWSCDKVQLLLAYQRVLPVTWAKKQPILNILMKVYNQSARKCTTVEG